MTKAKLRIAIDTTYMDRRPGKGTAIVIRRSVEEILKRTGEFDITLIHREPIPEDPIYAQVREIIIPRVQLPKFSGFISEFIFFLTTRERFDVYYFSYSRLYPTFWLAPAKRIVWAAMDGGPQTAGYGGKAKGRAPWYVRMFLGRVDAVIALSEFGKTGIISTYGIADERIHVVSNGLDEHFRSFHFIGARVQGVKERYQLPNSYILCVSRFDPHKNILRLLDAYASLRETTQISEPLVFVGGRHMPNYSDEVEERIRSLGLSEYVHIAPYIDSADLPDVYAGAVFMAFPSLYEGFGLPVIEAQACGTPVLISNIEALVETSGGVAEIVDPYDTDDMVRGLSELLLKASYRAELAVRGRENALQFTWYKHGKKLADVLRGEAEV